MTTPQELASAVRRVWSRHPRGFGFLAARRDGLWIERGFRVNDGDGVEDFFARYSFRRYDLYYCPNAFSQDRRKAVFALPTPYAHCDIDLGDPTVFDPPPTILVETSPSKFQGVWEHATAVEPKVTENLSRSLSLNGDRGGWSVTKMLRVPGSLNHKPAYDLPVVRVIRDDGEPIPAWPAVQSESTKEPRARAPSEVVIDPADYEAALARFNACLREHEPSPTRQMWLRKRLLRTRDQVKVDGINRSFTLRQVLCACATLS